MTFSHLPPLLTSAFADLAHWLQKRSAARLPRLLLGILFATGRRTVTSWFRAAGISTDYRNGYTTVCAVGRQASHMRVEGERNSKIVLDEEGGENLLGHGDLFWKHGGGTIRLQGAFVSKDEFERLLRLDA
jgi:hypothetical protein